MMNLTAKFEEGEYFTVASSLYQYDKNRTLEVEGVDLPNGYTEVQFSKDEKQGESIQKMGTVSNGKLTVDVPNALTFDELRTSDYSIWAFIYVTDEQMGRTVYKILMNVIARPELTGEAPEPDVENPFNDALQEVKKEVEKSKGYSESAKEFSDSAKGFSEQASDSKDEAERIKNEVVDLANGFDAKVNESIETITQTGTEQVGAVEQAGKQQTQTVNDAGSKQVQAVTDEGVKQKQELQKETELFKGDREQIAKNKDDILKLAIKPEVSGNPVVLKDSADFPAVSLELSGSTTQVQTSGKNLLNFSQMPQADYIGNDTWKIERVNVVVQQMPLNIPIPSKIEYDVKCEEGVNARLRFKFKDGTYSVMEAISDGTFKHVSYNITKEVVLVGLDYTILNKYVEIRRPIIYVGESTTYEPFTGGLPSPSPDWKQPVINGEWDSIGCTGKNLFDGMFIKNSYIDRNTGVLKLTGGENWNATEEYVEVFPNKQYTVNYAPNRDGAGSNAFYDSNKVFISSTKDQTFTTPSNAKYMRFTWRYADSDDNFQVEFGNKSTEYEPYKGFTETLSQKIQLSEWDSVKLVDGVWQKENRTGRKVFDGTEDWKWYEKGAYIVLTGDDRPKYDVLKITVLSNLFKGRKTSEPYQTNTIYITSGQITPNLTTNVDLSKIPDLATFKKVISKNNLEITYIRYKTIYEAFPPEAQDLLNKITTFYPNTVLQTNEGITFDLKYVADTKNYIDNKLNENINKLKTAIISAGGM